jgi:putative transposase
MSSQEKNAEILALRQPLLVLQRQLGSDRVRFTPSDRALLALLHGLPRDVLKRLRLVARPGTVLRWYRDMLARRPARRSRPARPGWPRTVRSICVLASRRIRILGRHRPVDGTEDELDHGAVGAELPA